ncbi:MAG: sugar phosphate nucleotidyltransferase [Pseudomonadota bacterium]
MASLIDPVPLRNGSGTRFLPCNTSPKQFVNLVGVQGLFQVSVLRFSGEEFTAPSIIIRVDFHFVIIDHLAALEMSATSILTQPAAKNTAAVICVAALALEALDPEALMLMAPSDHVIPDADHAPEVLATTARAFEAAERDPSLSAWRQSPGTACLISPSNTP